ncbi:MAG: hypothetical protein MPN21_23485 [Thermoanaerobaculia bacterium]|nr:hypothetical protein [Thermoanaerobaculia bacterium]
MAWPDEAEAIRRDPSGVNVNAQGATTVFITFGDLDEQVPTEAFWCGALIPATPDLGMRCDPSTIFGRLPIRFDQSKLAADRSSFTDIMTIPPSVARRAYQAAARGETSTFFYVRRFVSTRGGPSEFVFVTCRLTGGGARVPLALLDVRLAFSTGQELQAVDRNAVPPEFSATIAYNGTGRLRGRWEVVLPGEEPPSSRDLLTAATLPPEERPLQRRYTELSRFNVFLPPTGQVVLPGPDPESLPDSIDGLYLVLLRVEASDDKEGNSSLANAGAGEGVVHSGAVAGFPLPVLRYYVGATSIQDPGFTLITPLADAELAPGEAWIFSWTVSSVAALYQLEIAGETEEEPLFSALLQQGIATYRAPPWLESRLPGSDFVWRVVALGPDGEKTAETPWRSGRVNR